MVKKYWKNVSKAYEEYNFVEQGPVFSVTALNLELFYNLLPCLE